MSLQESELEPGTMYRIRFNGREYDQMYMGGGQFASTEEFDQVVVVEASPEASEDLIAHPEDPFLPPS